MCENIEGVRLVVFGSSCVVRKQKFTWGVAAVEAKMHESAKAA